MRSEASTEEYTDSVGASPSPAVPASPYAAGTILDHRYEIVAHLGRGGMAHVYEVVDLAAGRALALKIMHGLAQRPAALSLIRAEFRTLAALDHPNVVRVLDLQPLRDSDGYGITMELVRGTPLRRTVGRSLADTVELLVQICRALSYIHTRGVIHFDLKPENILVGDDNLVRLVDFGIAGERPTVLGGKVVGTRRYIAPELHQHGPVDHRADFYSLGVVLDELIEPAARPAWLRELLESLVDPQPSRRPRSANAIIEAINAGGQYGHAFETSETVPRYVMSPRQSGRDDETDRLLDAIDAHEPVPLVIVGPAGIGKSRLVREVRLRSQLAGTAFVEVSCYETGAGELEPILDALGQLRPLLGGAPLPAEPDSDGARDAFLDRAAEQVRAAARRAPLVLCVHDLHWASRAVLAWLGRIAEVPAPQLTLLGTYRSHDGSPDVRERLAVLARPRGLAELHLGALREPAVAELIGSMLGDDHVGQQLAARVTADTAGNPLVIQELMRGLVEAGSLHAGTDGWTLRSGALESDVPASIDGLFRSRLALMSPLERTVVDVLAVHARPLALEVLARAVETEDLAPALFGLQTRGVVVGSREQPSTFWLAHERMRGVAYSALAPDDARRIHLALAHAFEGVPDAVGDRAVHYRGAEILDRAVETSRAAAERDLRAHAHQTAVAHLTALRDLRARRPETPPATLAELELLADAQLRSRTYSDAQRTLDAALTLATTDRERARLYSRMSRGHFYAQQTQPGVENGWRAAVCFGEARPSGARALAEVARLGAWAYMRGLDEVTPKSPESSELANLYTWLGTAYVYENQQPLMIFASMLRAIHHAARASDDHARVMARSVFGVLLAWTNARGARRWCDATLRAAEHVHNEESAGICTMALHGVLDAHLAPLPGTLDALDRSVALLRKTGSGFLGVAHNFYIFEAHRLGRWADGLALYREITAHVRRSREDGFLEADYDWELPELQLHAEGDIPAALATYERTLDRARNSTHGTGLQGTLEAGASTLVAAGQTSRAIAALEESWQLASKARATLFTRNIFRLLPRLYAWTLPPAVAKRKISAIVRANRRLVASHHDDKRPFVPLATALVHELDGDRDRTVRDFDEAFAECRRQGTPTFLADTHVERARVRRRWGDRDGARADLVEARRISEATGDRYLVRACTETLATTGSIPPL